MPHVQLAYKEHERTSEKSSGAVARGAMRCPAAASNPLGCLGEGSQKSLLAVGLPQGSGLCGDVLRKRSIPRKT